MLRIPNRHGGCESHPLCWCSAAKKCAGAVLAAVLCAPAVLAGADYETLFRGWAEDDRIWAVSVGEDVDANDLTSLVSEPNTVLLVYRGYRQFSTVRPDLVYVDREIKLLYDTPEHSSDGDTVEDWIQAANLAGGQKLEAVCQDGSRAEVSGRWDLTRMMSAWGRCRSRGGVQRAFYTTYKDTNAVIACICRDYRLVAGDGRLCGERQQILVRVRNRDY